MKKISLFALSLLFLTSCKYSGTWGVKEELVFKTKSGLVSIPRGAHAGYISATKSKFALTFRVQPDIKIQIKIPKEKFHGNTEAFEVKGADIGQTYDFKGISKTEVNETSGTCEALCENQNGFPESCVPAGIYNCTTSTTTTYVELKLLDPSTREEKATFAGSETTFYTSDDDNDWRP